MTTAISDRFDSVFDKLEKFMELQELYEAVLHSIANGIVVFDVVGKVHFANHAFLEHTGYDKDRVINKKVCDFVPREYRKTTKWFADKTPELNKTKEVVLRGKDGALMVKATVYGNMYNHKSLYIAVLDFS